MAISYKNSCIKKCLQFILLIISGYQLWLVADRWIAAIKYRISFGADSGQWISLGIEAIIFGFGSLLLVCALALWVRRLARNEEDILSQRVSAIVLTITLTAAIALLILVLLPTTSLMKR